MDFTINFDRFRGANTFVDETLLEAGICTASVDQEPTLDGVLMPRRDVGPTVRTLTPVLQQKTIWRAGQAIKSESDYWYSFTNRVDLVRGFEATDTNERTYYTGDGAPKWTDTILGLTGGAPYPQGSRLLGVPAPTLPLTVAIAVDGVGTEAAAAFVYTYVTTQGWESAPSPPSNQPLAKPGATFNLGNFQAPQGGYNIELVRLYKGVSDGAGGFEYFFFREWTVLGGTPANPIGDARAIGADALSTEGWRPPPTDGFGIKRLWGGMLAMLSGKAMRICEPYKHYAWPLRYEIGLSDEAVAIGVWGQRGIVLTGGDAVLFAGNDPAAMDDEPAKINRPCSSAASVVEFNEGEEQRGVAWASEQGLCWYGDGGFQLLTDQLITPEQWQAMNPSTMAACQHKGRYVCFYTDGQGVRRGFILDPKNRVGFYSLSKGYDAVYRDPKGDVVFVLDGKNIKRWDVGAAMTASVKSKVFTLPYPCSLAAMEVKASAWPVTVKMWVDGTLRMTRLVTSSAAFRPTFGNLGERVQFELQCAGRVQALRAAEDMEDL